MEFVVRGKVKLNIEKKKPPVAKSELLQVAEIVAKDKGFDRNEVLSALEEAMLSGVQTRYGSNKNLTVNVNRSDGSVTVNWVRKIVDVVNDYDNEISLSDARKSVQNAKIGDNFLEELPPVEFTRSMVQSARQIINQKLRDTERKYQFKEFSNRIGDILVGVVNRMDFSNVVLDIGHSEGIIRKSELIPNEVLKVGDRVKVLLCGLNQETNVPLLQLSRTHPDFIKKLFAQEVPEVYDGIVKIMAVARDPGSKAKMAVNAADPSIDAVGACVGPKGIRVRTVSDELCGEKIDIVKWSDDPVTFIVNSLIPARPTRVILDESAKKVDAIVSDDQLSLAIGRRGQNVRLASRLTGWAINAITEKKALELKNKEYAAVIGLFKDSLDVDADIAQCLVNAGFVSVSEVVESSIDELSRIEGFDLDLAKEVHDRASLYLKNKMDEIAKLCQKENVDEDLKNYDLIYPELLELLVKAGIKSLNDLRELSSPELLEISTGLLNKSEAEDLIMDVRSTWFNK